MSVVNTLVNTSVDTPVDTILTVEDVVRQIVDMDKMPPSLCSNSHDAEYSAKIMCDLENHLQPTLQKYLHAHHQKSRQERLHSYLQDLPQNTAVRLENPNNFEMVKYLIDSVPDKKRISITISNLVEHYKRATEHAMENYSIYTQLDPVAPKCVPLMDYVKLFRDNGCDIVFDVTVYDIIKCSDADLLSEFCCEMSDNHVTISRSPAYTVGMMLLINDMAEKCKIIKYSMTNGDDLVVVQQHKYNKMFDILMNESIGYNVFDYIFQITNEELRTHIGNRIHSCIGKASDSCCFHELFGL